MSNIIQHIAFIMDGNRRWAKKRGKNSLYGHQAGTKNLKHIARACREKGVKVVTFWTLSTENLKERSSRELSFLFGLIQQAPRVFAQELREDIKIVVPGDISKLPAACRKVIRDTEQKTKNKKSFTLVLPVNYGGREEIAHTFQRLLSDSSVIKRLEESKGDAFEFLKTAITEKLDIVGIPDPELVIRTGGRSRLSGFMPWQTVYSELYFSKTLWPDFSEKELDKAIRFFNSTQRNFGK